MLSDPREAVLAFFTGDPVIVLDTDENGENEGDFMQAGELIAPKDVKYVKRNGLCKLVAAVSEPTAQRLGLTLPDTALTDEAGMRRCRFTQSVDVAPHAAAARGWDVKTGVSSRDVAYTLNLLADPDAQPRDLDDSDGHVPVAIAAAGLFHERCGHTESIIALCNLAGLSPAGVMIEIEQADGYDTADPDEIIERFGGIVPITTIDALRQYWEQSSA